MSGHSHGDETKITARWVPWAENIVVFSLMFILLFVLTESLLLTALIGFTLIGIIVPKLIVSPPPFWAAALNHPIWGTSRIIFNGGNLKSVFEILQKEMTDLHTPTDELFDVEFSTKGPTRRVRLVLSVVPDDSNPDRSRKVMLWRKHEKGGVMKNARATVRGILAPYFEGLGEADPIDPTLSPAEKKIKAKVDKSLDNAGVIRAINEDAAGVKAIHIFEEENGARFMWKMEDVNRTEQEEQMHNELASFRLVNEATKLLIDEGGWEADEAKEYVRLRTLDNATQVNWKFDAPPTLTSVSVVGTPQAPQNKPSGNKKPRNPKGHT